MDIQDFVSKQLKLLEIERNAEIEEKSEYLQDVPLKTLQQRGVLIQRLKLGSHRTTLYGRCLCSFQTQWPGKPLPYHRITPGDIVGVCEGDGSQRKALCTGVADEVNSLKVKLAFDSSWEALDLKDDAFYSLMKLTNDVTYKRIKRALLDLQKPEAAGSHLTSVLFGHQEPSTNNLAPDLLTLQFLNTNLNEEQSQAVSFALRQKELAIVHGPPGTGKTTTLVEIIRQTVKQKTKVLVCAPSNVAVDNLVEHLASVKPTPKLVRLGHPSRLLPQIQGYSLDALLDKSHHASVLDDIRKEIEKLGKEGDRNHRQQQGLRKELRERERSAEADILKSADVVLSTLTAASTQGPLRHLEPDHFGLVVIDECSQATEAACWIVLPRASKCVLAGDHLQLPPTIISKQAAAEGLSISLMERLCKLLEEKCTRMLCTQYRMHQHIMDWASVQLYQGMLKASAAVATHRLCDLTSVDENETTNCVLLLIDTAGCGLYETEIEGEESKANSGEAGLVSIHVTRLVNSGLNPADIAVITPYNLQVEFLRQRLSETYPSLEIQSVDGFQGREKEAVVLSLVRSNNKREIGFLAESRRINVAVTRARRHLAVVCDTDTVGTDPFLKSLTEHISTFGEVQTAHQYTQELEEVDFCVPAQAHKAIKKASGAKSKTDKPKEQKTTKKVFPVGELRSEERVQHSQKSSEEELKSKFQAELQAFVDDDNIQSISFSSKLTSFERRVIHLLCEQLGLVHLSKDEEDKRYIEVSKKCPASAKTLDDKCALVRKVEEKSSPLQTEEDSHPDEDNENRANVQKNEDDSVVSTAKIKSKKKVKKKKEIVVPDPALSEDKDDFDALLASVVQSDNTCSQARCTTSTSLMSQTCLHCKKRWCFKHALPEIHGCGEAAKAHARKEMHSSAPPRVDPVKRVHLKRNLDKTLSKMAQQRKQKQDQSKK